MTFTPIAKGTPNWDSPLNLALTQLDNSITSSTASALQAANNLSDLTNVPLARTNLQLGVGAVVDSVVVNVKDHGALGNNTADDTSAIQAAINICPLDGVVYFPVGLYRTTAPLIVPPGITLMGQKQKRPRNAFSGATNLGDGVYISPRSTFTGSAVILIKDAQSAGTTVMAQGTRIIGIYINGSALLAGSNVDGIQALGQVQGLILKDCSVSGVSNYCYNFARNASVGAGPSNPFSLRVIGCYATGGGTATTVGGFFLYQCTDSTFEDCETIAVGGDGWTIQGGGNSTFLACRSENNSGNGFVLGTTSGGTNATANMVSCSTNGNAGHGFNVTSSYTVNFVGCHSGGEGVNNAGFNIASSTGVVALNNCMAASSGSTSKYGLQIGSTLNAVINGGIYYGMTAGYNDAGGNTNVYLSPNVIALTGNISTPTVSSPGILTNATGTVGNFNVGSNLSVTGTALGLPRPSDHGSAIAWTADPVTINGGTAPAASGTVYLSALYVNKTITATKLFWAVTSPGLTTPVAGQNFVGLYNSAGTRLATVNVDGRTGTNTMFTETISVALTPGLYWVGFVFNATTLPTIAGPAGLLTSATSFNNTASTSRWATAGTAQTTLPTTITPSSNGVPTISRFYWAALA